MKQPRPRFNNLVDRETDQAKVVFFPDNWRSAYSTYTALYSGGLLRSGRQRASFKEIVKHGLLLGLWMGVLTLFFASQRGVLHHPHLNLPYGRGIEAHLMQPSKGTL